MPNELQNREDEHADGAAVESGEGKLLIMAGIS